MLLWLALSCIDQSWDASNSAPEAAIVSHEDGDVALEGYVVLLRGSVSDPNHAEEELSVSWYVDNELLCESSTPSADGSVSCEAVFEPGDRELSLEVRDPEGSADSDFLTLSVQATDAPDAEIVQPVSDGVFYVDVKLAFEALVWDGEDSPEELTVEWESDLDGVLDLDPEPDTQGTTLDFAYLSEGNHALTLRVTDTTGKTGVASVVIDVGPTNSAPGCAIVEPADSESAQEGEEIVLQAEVSDPDVSPSVLEATFSSNLDGDLGTLSPASDGTVSLATSALAQGTHTLTFTVTDELGASCTDAILFTVGTPPTVLIDSPTTGDVVNEGDSSTFSGTVSDDQDAAQDLALEWSSDADGSLNSTGADSGGTASFSTSALSLGAHTISLTATDSDGLYSRDTINLTVNGLPDAPTISLSPDPADTEDALSVSIDSASTDPEGDALSYSYSWYVDGNPSSASTSSSLAAADTSKGETWTVEVRADDGYGEGDAGSASLTIDNSPPVLADVALTPDPASVEKGLTCTPGTTTDADSDSVTYSYTWQKDGSDLTGKTNSTLGKANLTKGDSFTCTVTPNDGDDDGSAVVSNSVDVENAAPSVSSVAISPDPATVDDELECSWSFDDADGDSDQSTVAWTVNGSSAGSGSTLSSGFTGGDTVSCTVTPGDGSDTGTADSASITIGNTAPTVTDVEISPDPAVASDTLSCSWSFDDADGDSDQSTVKWKISGTTVGTSTTLSGAFVKDDTVKCVVTPDDGTDTGTNATASITIDNTAPEITSLSLSPSSLYTKDTLSASVSSSDDDGDSVSYDYLWYVDGSLVSSTGSTLSGTSWFDKDQTVYVVVTPNDGDEDGGSETSGTITVLNSAPAAPSVAIDPSDPVEQEDGLLCEITSESVDDDGDAVTYSVEWEVDGLPYVAGGGDTADTATPSWVGPSTTDWTDDTADAQDTWEGEEWSCTVTPDDGDITGSSASDSVTIQTADLDYTDVWELDSSVRYSCAYGIVSINLDSDGDGTHTWTVVDSYPNISVSSGSSQPGTMTGSWSSSTDFSATTTFAGSCTETYTVSGTVVDANEWSGTFTARFTGGIYCLDCSNQSWSFTATR